MAVTQYIGARYVPIIADPIEWDSTRTYEPLTIVTYQGNSYTSRQYVPIGIDISNESYWALTGNYNAQIEQYRTEVQTFDARIASNAANIATNTSDIADNAADIATNTTNIAMNASDIASNAADIATNTANIATNADDIATNAANIATNAGNIATNTADIATNTADIAALEAVTAQRHMVVIGDSFSTPQGSQSNSDMWWYQVAQTLGVTPHSYAHNGSGFVRHYDTQTDFVSQLANAVADTAFDNDEVAYVFFMGAINDAYMPDLAVTGQAYLLRVRNALNSAASSFPNAKIILAGCNTFANIRLVGTELSSVTVYTDVAVIRRTLWRAANSANRTQFIDITPLFVGAESWFDSDTNHPTNLGQKALACAIRSGKAQALGIPEFTSVQGSDFAQRSTDAMPNKFLYSFTATTVDNDSNTKIIELKDKHNALALAYAYAYAHTSYTMPAPVIACTALKTQVIQPYIDVTDDNHITVKIVVASQTNIGVRGFIEIPLT